MQISESRKQRFWKHVDKSGACWNWTASQAGGGYGTVNIDKKNWPSHRAAWVISGNEIPEGASVLQKCRNRLCCNPDHLFVSSKPKDAFRVDRFFERVKKTDGCWNWIGTLNSSGYGLILVNYKTIRAHRFSWELHNGKITGGLYVLHKCDNPRCVNPDHLFLGTQSDNHADMHAKKRNNQPKGSKSGMAKLDERSVSMIRKGGHTDSFFAKKFNVSRETIAYARKRGWRHVK